MPVAGYIAARITTNTNQRMKRLLLGVCALLCSTLAYSQPTGIVVETINDDIGMVGMTDLTGYSTYRVYVKFSHPDDFLSAVAGDAGNGPVIIEGGNNFYQDALGGLTPQPSNPALFPAFPSLEFDSYITIGVDGPANGLNGEAEVSIVSDENQPWGTTFEAGNDLIIDSPIGGAWFATNIYSNGVAGADSLVLIGQFTTDAELTGQITFQTFIQGEQGETVTDTSGTLLTTLAFSSVPDAVFGCVDPDAENTTPGANTDDGSCVYACDYPATQLEVVSTGAEAPACFGFSNGQASVVVTGGQGGVTYSLSGSSPNATGIFSNVPSGDAVITITDAQGCEVMATVSVPEASQIELDAILSDPISCNGESDAVISGSASGGAGDLQFSMSAPITDTSGTYFEMGSDVLLFDGLGEGIYSVYALDTNGCVLNSSNIVVAQPTPFNLYAQAVAPTTCPGTEDGTVVLNFFGGSGDGTTYSTDGSMYSTENTFTLPSGTYTFYAQDVNGCPDTLTDVEVVTPSAFESLAELVSPTCFGDMNGSITVDVQGGTAPLEYVVNGDTLDMVMLNMVAGGDYAIEVVDANGCSFDASVTLDEPAAIVPEATVTDVLCNGDENGGFVITATGGSGMGYTYDVDNGGFGPNGEYTGLAAGTYMVTVQDDAECTGSVDIAVGSPDAIEVSVDANGGATGAESDGTLDITVTGGTAPYSYSWAGPGFTSEDEDPSGLAAGDYTVTITDGNGCEFTSTTIVVVSGLDEMVNLIDVTLFPNPTRGMVDVQFNGLMGESVTAVLTDGLGREVSRNDLGNLTGAHLQRMDLSGFESGVYYLRLEVADAVEVLRVVKQ